jgi:two-component system, chemotaxis family, protein-glutamate methylesterase/glutaminase
MRVLVTDDSAFMRKALTALLASDKSIEVVDTALHGEDALKKIALHKPDVVTLDIEMPVMDGLTCLSKIRLMPEPRPAVLVCSTLTVAGSQHALKALRLGATDVICKEPDQIGAGNERTRTDIIARVKAIAPGARAASLKPANATAKPAAREWQSAGKTFDCVVIGSSTGGPPVLESILVALPAEMPMPIVVAQHMPGLFTKSMSERLNEVCKIRVMHAENDCLLEAGTAYITQGGKHARVHKMSAGKYRLEVSGKPETALYKPSVNELFASAASGREKVLAVQLTGMGDDGAIGGKQLFHAGGTILAQLGETCAVYGMPKAIVEHGLAAAALTPKEIAEALAGLGVGSRASKAA